MGIGLVFLWGILNVHRDRMPNYPLQWEAMRWARSHDCNEYDLWGVPDEDLNTLEANFPDELTGFGVYIASSVVLVVSYVGLSVRGIEFITHCFTGYIDFG